MTMVRTYKRYDKYFNPERTEWIKEIPDGWTQKRIGFELDLITGYAFQSERFTYDDGIKLVRGDNVTEGHLRWGDKLRMWPEPTEHLKQFLLNEGDVLIGMDGSKVGKNYALVKEEDLPLLLVQRVARLRSRKNLDPKFLYYCIGNELFLFWVTINKTDPMIPHITPKDITNFEIPFPSIAEQRSIANFLDKKTKQIDNLIEQKEKLLQLLTEKRTAVITHAVTKGLDSKVKMKDSGIEWLGEVPGHWDVCLLKYKCKISYGIGGEIDRTLKEGVPLLSLPNINKDGTFNMDDVAFADVTNYEKELLKLEKGDLLFNWRNGSSDHLGKTAFFDLEGEYLHVSFLLKLRFNESKDNSRFYQYTLNGFQITGFFASSKAGVNNTFNLSELSNLWIAVPPKAEQDQIAFFIRERTTKIDKAIKVIAQSLIFLHEYRSSLITSAVTGQIDVRA